MHLAGTWGEWNPGVLMGRNLGNITLVGDFLCIAERARELAVLGAIGQTKHKYDGAVANASGVQHIMGEIDVKLAATRAILNDTTTHLDTLLGVMHPGMFLLA